MGVIFMKTLIKVTILVFTFLLSLDIYGQSATPEQLKRSIQDYSFLIACCSNTNPCASQKECAEYYFNRGAAKYMLKDYTGAIEDLDKSIELDVNKGMSYMTRGLAYKDLGNMKAACSDWTKANELGTPRADEMKKKFCNK
jgi:tetratricopeptide (TPR) repeat protein